MVIRLKAEQLEVEQEIGKINCKIERDEQLSKSRKRYFKKFDEYLDRASHGPDWLREERIASIVADAMHYRDEKEYNLLAYNIMPNHVHIVFDVARFAESRPSVRDGVSHYIVTDIIGSLKKHTALESNKILLRDGAFWQHESYDHVVRNEAELGRIIEYVLYNPVKAGLVKEWTDWRWSYYKYSIS